MQDRCFRTVALVARPPGLAILRDVLLNDRRLEVVAVFTHGSLPKAEGGGTRDDLTAFRELCSQAGVPLIVADSKEAAAIGDRMPAGELDLLLSLSWRNIVRPDVLQRFRLGTLNIHRGALPDFAGAAPVQRAIESAAPAVAITAHEMVETVDAGREIARVWLPIDPLGRGQSAGGYAEVVKDRLLPLYAPLCRLAIDAVIEGRAGKAKVR